MNVRRRVLISWCGGHAVEQIGRTFKYVYGPDRKARKFAGAGRIARRRERRILFGTNWSRGGAA